MHLWRCGILDRIQISVGRCCGCILFRFVFIFIRVLVFIFLSLPFVVFSFTLFFGGGKKKFYYCAMEMRSAILLSFSFGWVFLHFLFAAGWIFLKFCFLHFIKKTRSNKIPAVFTWLENDFPWWRAWKIVSGRQWKLLFFCPVHLRMKSVKSERKAAKNKKNRWTYTKMIVFIGRTRQIKKILYCV